METQKDYVGTFTICVEVNAFFHHVLTPKRKNPFGWILYPLV